MIRERDGDSYRKNKRQQVQEQEQPKVLRLRNSQNMRVTSLRMTHRFRGVEREQTTTKAKNRSRSLRDDNQKSNGKRSCDGRSSANCTRTTAIGGKGIALFPRSVVR